jgi:hypothetical protein
MEQQWVIMGIISAPGYINLGHELAHAYLKSTGKNDYSEWYIKGDTRQPVSVDEKLASQIENKIRADFNLPRRAWYHYYYRPTGLGNKIEKEGEIPN